MRCRCRPKRRLCPGRLRVCDRGDDMIQWQCPSRGDQGTINGWRGHVHDLSDLRGRAVTRRVQLSLSESEFDAVKAGLVYDRESLATIYGATPTPDGIVLNVAADDLDELADALASEANHESNRKRRRLLDQVLGRLDVGH